MTEPHLPAPTVIGATPYPYAAVPQGFANPGVSLQQLLSIVWAYRKVTIGIVCAAVVLAVVATKLSAKTYRATATLMIDYQVNDPLGGDDFPVGLMGSYMSTQVELIRSPAVLIPVVDKLDLTDDEDYIAGYDGKHGTAEEWAKNQLARNLTVEQGAWGSQLIYVSYNADSPQEAARVANAVADTYEQQQSQRLNGPASKRAKRYTEQLQVLKRNVDEAQARLTAFRQQNDLLGNEEDSDIKLERLANLQHRLLEAQQQRRTAEAALTGGADSRDNVIASPAIQQLRNQLASLQSRMAELRTTLGPRHPQIVELQSQIASTQQSLAAEMSIYEENAQSRLAAALSVERQLKTAVDEELETALRHRRLIDQSAQYELELKTAQTLYDRALDGYDQIVLTSGGGYNNVSSISRATPPVKPTKPKPLLNLAMALAIGGFLGLIGPLIYEFFFRRIRCRDDLDRDFGVPVLVEFGPQALGARA